MLPNFIVILAQYYQLVISNWKIFGRLQLRGNEHTYIAIVDVKDFKYI